MQISKFKDTPFSCCGISLYYLHDIPENISGTTFLDTLHSLLLLSIAKYSGPTAILIYLTPHPLFKTYISYFRPYFNILENTETHILLLTFITPFLQLRRELPPNYHYRFEKKPFPIAKQKLPNTKTDLTINLKSFIESSFLSTIDSNSFNSSSNFPNLPKNTFPPLGLYWYSNPPSPTFLHSFENALNQLSNIPTSPFPVYACITRDQAFTTEGPQNYFPFELISTFMNSVYSFESANQLYFIRTWWDPKTNNIISTPSKREGYL